MLRGRLLAGVVAVAMADVVAGCQRAAPADTASLPAKEPALTSPVPTPSPPPGLEAVNECLRRYDVSIYTGSDGRLRLAGDINRMQDVVDGSCRSLITKAMHEDFTIFFAEVDQKVAECLRESGADATYDPDYGVDPGGADPELVESCFYRTYDYYRIPRTST